VQTSPPRAMRGRGGWLLIGLNALLFVAGCALALYAFVLNVDLGEVKRQLSREAEARQQAERYLAETRDLLQRSQRELEQLKSELELRASAPEALHSAKPAMPVVVGFRSSLIGKGMVATIDNSSDHYLRLVLSVRNPTLSTARRFVVELGPRASQSFGHLEGWQFASGDEMSLFHEDFAPIRLQVP